MFKSVKAGRRASTSFWVIAIVFLLILNGGLALIVLRGFVTPTVQSAAAPSAARTVQSTAVPSATPTASPQPQHPTIAQLPQPTRQPTRTPRARPTIRPVPTDQPPQATADASPGCTETNGQVMDETYSSRILGSDQRYIVYLPPCYDSTQTRYPTLYLLHGLGYDATHWESLGVFKAMDKGLEAKQLAPAIIILPEADENLFGNTSGGSGSFEAQFVQELMPVVNRLYRTDPRPEWQAIGGISRGGVWSLEISFVHPDKFGIVGGHSPCLNYNNAPPQFDPLKLTDKPALKTQRIWLDAGDRDGCLVGTEEIHAALEKSGVAHSYQIWPGIHEDSYWASHLNDYMTFYTQSWPRP